MADSRKEIDDKILLEFEKLNTSIVKINKRVGNILKYNENQDKKINDIHEVIYGNGDTEKGLATKHSRLDEKVKSMVKTIKIHWGLISTILIAAVVLIIRSI